MDGMRWYDGAVLSMSPSRKTKAHQLTAIVGLSHNANKDFTLERP